MSDLEEVDVTKQIDDNDDKIQLSEPESDPEDDEGLEDEGVKDEDTIKEATVFPEDDIGVDTYIPQQIDVEDENELEEDKIPQDEEGEIPEKNEESKSKKPDESKQVEVSVPQEKGNVSESSDSSDSENEDDDEELQKIEREIDRNFLLEYHPELKQINYKELLTLCKVVRNKKGNIIDPLHTTIPFLTRYEKAKVLGLRAKQINNGADPLIALPRSIIDGHTIALMELKENKIPFIIKRPLPNGGNEYWKVCDLQNLE